MNQNSKFNVLLFWFIKFKVKQLNFNYPFYLLQQHATTAKHAATPSNALPPINLQHIIQHANSNIRPIPIRIETKTEVVGYFDDTETLKYLSAGNSIFIAIIKYLVALLVLAVNEYWYLASTMLSEGWAS